jgi:hypothetical protein
MSNNEHAEHLRDAERARQGLVADLRDMNHAGEQLVRHGKRELKSTAVTLGAVALGGVAIGVAVGRLSTGRRGNSALGDLLGRATSAFAATLATQLFAMLTAKRG